MGKGHDSSCQYASKGRYFGHKKRSITTILRVMLLFFCFDFLFYRWKKREYCIDYTILQQKNIQNHKKVILEQMVPVVGLEPTRYRYQRILSPSRLPFHHTGKLLDYYTLRKAKNQVLFWKFFPKTRIFSSYDLNSCRLYRKREHFRGDSFPLWEVVL